MTKITSRVVVVLITSVLFVGIVSAASVEDYKTEVGTWARPGCQRAVAEKWVQGDENGNARWGKSCTTERTVHIAGAAAESESMKVATAFGQLLGQTNGDVVALAGRVSVLEGAKNPPSGGAKTAPNAPTGITAPEGTKGETPAASPTSKKPTDRSGAKPEAEGKPDNPPPGMFGFGEDWTPASTAKLAVFLLVVGLAAKKLGLNSFMTASGTQIPGH